MPKVAAHLAKLNAVKEAQKPPRHKLKLTVLAEDNATGFVYDDKDENGQNHCIPRCNAAEANYVWPIQWRGSTVSG